MTPTTDPSTGRSSGRAQSLLVLLVALGVVGFLYGISQGYQRQTWSIYLINLLFWSSLSVTGPAIAGMIQLTEGRWSPTIKRVALTTAGFLPISFVLFVALFAGRAVLYPWVNHPLPAKAVWLNVPLMSLRLGIGVVLLYWVAMRYTKAMIAADRAGIEAEVGNGRLNRLSTILLMLYVVVLSLWGFDLIMSLDPLWYSGLLGGYYVVSSMYAGFCLVTYLTLRYNESGVTAVAPKAIQDVVKLAFSLGLVWMYFFFSQYLIIWYGNVPLETRFFVRGFLAQPWGHLAWAIFIVGWLIPFSYLLKVLTGRPPTRHQVLKVILWMAGIAIFFERLLVVSVSLKQTTIPHGIIDILVTLGFFALFVLSRNWFLARYNPVLSLPK
jgi:hypothetical protein